MSKLGEFGPTFKRFQNIPDKVWTISIQSTVQMLGMFWVNTVMCYMSEIHISSKKSLWKKSQHWNMPSLPAGSTPASSNKLVSYRSKCQQYRPQKFLSWIINGNNGCFKIKFSTCFARSCTNVETWVLRKFRNTCFQSCRLIVSISFESSRFQAWVGKVCQHPSSKNQSF